MFCHVRLERPVLPHFWSLFYSHSTPLGEMSRSSFDQESRVFSLAFYIDIDYCEAATAHLPSRVILHIGLVTAPYLHYSG